MSLSSSVRSSGSLPAARGEPYMVPVEEFACMRSDYDKYGKLVRAIGATME